MQFPIQLKFKILSFAPKIFVLDARGEQVAFVRQKFFKLREHVEVFSDESRQDVLCHIKADRIIDFSASYEMRLADGSKVGTIRRRGLRSIWKASYEILNEQGQVDYEIHEKNPFVKVLDSLVGQVPVVGFLTGLLLHPKYQVVDRSGKEVMVLKKRVSLFERQFGVELMNQVPEQDHLRIVLSLLMFTLLERNRG